MAGNFNHQSTADDVLEGINLQDKRVLVTGGVSGIGAETVRAMAAKGAEVIIAARNQQQAEEVQAAAVAATGNQNISIVSLDLASLVKVDAAAREFLQRFDRLDVLINNAGVMACPFDKTVDGFELQFGSNHLGHFYLTKLLMPALLNAGALAMHSLQWPTVCRSWYSTTRNMNGETMRSGRLTANRKRPMRCLQLV